MAILHPLECYLLEKFTSPEHYVSVRDAIIDWVDTHEAAYSRILENPDPRQRSKPLWQQGDIVWGQRVLPNIRPIRNHYIKSYIMRVNNDPHAFKAGTSMSSCNKGMLDCDEGWMTTEEQLLVERARRKATDLEALLELTVLGTWREGYLTYSGQDLFYKISDLPKHINRYVLDPSVRVSNHKDVRQTGIYLPDADFAAARLLYPTEFDENILAYQGVRRGGDLNEFGKPDYHWAECKWVETTWTLIRRIENEFLDVPERGFFPSGKPEELYTWSEREHEFASD